MKSINNKIKYLIVKTKNQINVKGSIANEITTRGNFLKKLKDAIKSNRDTKLQLDVVSLKDSKTAEPIIVELTIIELES